MENKETFHYTYSAKEQEEIRAIRKKYAKSEQAEDPMTKLRRLDAAVTQKATAVSLICGVIGALLLGSGMSLVMTDIGKLLSLSGGRVLIWGILIGIAGIGLVGAAYPLYNRIVRKSREIIAPEIIRLTDALLK